MTDRPRPPAALEEGHVTVVDAGVVYTFGPAHFPALDRARDGNLLVTFSTKPDGHPGGAVHVMRSADEGRTWTPPVGVASSACPDGSALATLGLTVLSDGAVLLPFCDIRLRRSYDDRSVALRLLRSSDDGRTWVESPRISLPYVEPIPYGRIQQLGDAELLMPIWGRRRLGQRWRAAVIDSPDRGHSWQWRATIAYDGGARLAGSYVDTANGAFSAGAFHPTRELQPDFRPHSFTDGFNETDIVRLASGKVLAILRQQGVGGRDDLMLYRSVSGDAGRSWSRAETIGLCGMSPALHSAGRRTILLGYRNRVKDRVRPGITVALSHDEGRTFVPSAQLVHPLGAPEFEYQTGYPAFVDRADGDVLVVFYSFAPSLPHGRYLAYNVLRVVAGPDADFDWTADPSALHTSRDRRSVLPAHRAR